MINSARLLVFIRLNNHRCKFHAQFGLVISSLHFDSLDLLLPLLLSHRLIVQKPLLYNILIRTAVQQEVSLLSVGLNGVLRDLLPLKRLVGAIRYNIRLLNLFF